MSVARFLLTLVFVGLVTIPALADTVPPLIRGTMPSLDQGRGRTAQRFTPAPVPNLDITAPRRRNEANEVQVSPGLTRMNMGQALAGHGFAAGSAYGGELDRRSRSGIGSAIPSLNLKMPVELEFR